jgi:trehalose 6-phosphate phosphatase
MRRHTRGVTSPATATALLAPLREDPTRAAVLLDVDGTLAPIVRHADDASVSEATRSLLTALARKYAVAACVSGRRATDTRRIVSIGSMAYVGNHGGELLPPGGTGVVVDPELAAWAPRVQSFAGRAFTRERHRMRLRVEDKGPIQAFHWRGAPNEEAAQAEIAAIAADAREEGFETHWGRKVLEIRPPVRIDKGMGVRSLLRGMDLDAALYAGDDYTDLDVFRTLGELVEEGRLGTAVRVGVRSDEGPAEIERDADFLVDGTRGVDSLLRSLLE